MTTASTHAVADGQIDAAVTQTATLTKTTAESLLLAPAAVDALADSLADSLDRAEAAAAATETDASYWDLASMAPLNARAAAAVARLRAFRSPAFPAWDRLPLSRRAAVLVLLYADRRGDLRVVLTMRAASLRNYSGHAAFPGGKADSLDETAVQIARREAWEEIGLPMDDHPRHRLPPAFRIEHLCDLPHNLAKTELVVRPVVALLHAERTSSPADEPSEDPSAAAQVEEALIPRLDAKEVAAVFSAPFHNFLRAVDEVPPVGPVTLRALRQPSTSTTLPPGPWYEGTWIQWHSQPWRMHFFYVPVLGQRVATPRRDEEGSPEPVAEAAAEEADSRLEENENSIAVTETTGPYGERLDVPMGRYKVWGMTARILVDAAQLAYGETPEFPHNTHFGDEAVIAALVDGGRLLSEKKRRPSAAAAAAGAAGAKATEAKEASKI